MNSFVQLALDWLDVPARLLPEKTARTQDKTPAIQSLTQVLDVARFHHPRANRFIHLGIGSADYRLTRSRRKTIGMSVGPDGLDVRAPRWASMGAIESALHEKGEWILRKLQEMQERQKHMQASVIEWRDGVSLPFLGEQVVLQLDSSPLFKDTGARLDKTFSADGSGASQILKVSVAQNADASQIRDAVQAWLMQQAKQLFSQRLNHYAPALGVHWKKLSLSNASTRWGSAASDGSIQLNWRLVHFKLDIIDYVVVHELSHLRVMDHSPMFWKTVRNVVPDYAQRRTELREESLPQWA
ncbi:MAG: M48 family peptidase [Limnohabitans sp.]|nr:M48 family peptidase [Limnohabitans sp.]